MSRGGGDGGFGFCGLGGGRGAYMQVDGEKDVGRLERVADMDDAGDDDDNRYTGNIENLIS